MHHTVLVWFRRDLRLFDHAALYYALKKAERVIAVFVFDQAILNDLPRCDRRVSFIWESLLILKDSLRQHGSDLIVRYGMAIDCIPALAHEYQAEAVYTNHDIEPMAIERDATVAKRLSLLNKEFYTYKDHAIFEKDEIRSKNGGMYQVFTPYKEAWLTKINSFFLKAYPVTPHLKHLAPLPPQSMPSLDEMGFDTVNVSYLKPGTIGAETLLEDFIKRIDHYHEARNFPAIKGVSYLSTHIRFGTLSIRELAQTAYGLSSQGAHTWLSELIWREFFQQLLWHHPHVVNKPFQTRFNTLVFPNDPDYFKAWCTGETGFPIVDAAMRQLNQTGFMHNRLRMITASFLVKDLLVDWRLGEAYFARHLNDFDLSANNGNWQWAASVGCDAQPYFRIFNPLTQSKRFDPTGAFIKRYIPALKACNDKDIHAPYDSKNYHSSSFDYPRPIIVHAEQRQKALVLYRDCHSNFN